MRYEGSIFKTNKCGNLIVTKYVSHTEVHIKFIETGYETITHISQIGKGHVKDRLIPTVHGVGILGDEPTKINGKTLREYDLWKAMLKRCYDEKSHNTHPTYKDCVVSDNFKYFPYFKEWCNKQVGFNSIDEKGKSFALDKDILIKGNKVYSEDTCCFVPAGLNSLVSKASRIKTDRPIGVSYNKFKGQFYAKHIKYGKSHHLGYFKTEQEAFLVYKKSKEGYVKQVINNWESVLDPRVYDALMNYQVEITD